MGIAGRARHYLAKALFRDRRQRVKPKLRQVWSIGVYGGESPLDLHPLGDVENPILSRTDIGDGEARFVADPFALHVEDRWFLFFETVGRSDNRGRIGMATSKDGLHWRYQGIVLAEPFHLSYPCVFAWNGRYFMVPESGAVNAIRLYEADAFPWRWRYVGSLLDRHPYVDATVFQWDERWWLFSAEGHSHDTLRLFTAPDLFGPWQEHPASPVISGDGRVARPAGKPLRWNGRLFRFAQDCVLRYGVAVRAFEIRRLTLDEYEEVEAQPQAVLAATGNGWNALGMHHLDLHWHDDRWLAFVDGRVDLLE